MHIIILWHGDGLLQVRDCYIVVHRVVILLLGLACRKQKGIYPQDEATSTKLNTTLTNILGTASSSHDTYGKPQQDTDVWRAVARHRTSPSISPS